MVQKKYLQWFLWLVCLHSVGVGLGLILFPSSWLAFFGLTVDAYRFFSTQGGVFHLVMSVAYGMTARDPDKHPGMLVFIITTKLIAFIFLSIYFLFIENFVTVALSGIADGLMAIVLLFFYLKLYSQGDPTEVTETDQTSPLDEPSVFDKPDPNP